jgi:uncharacterized linocin/CFP29 family protein
VSEHLFRSHAPITDVAWKTIEDDVRPRLHALLAARRFVDFKGPLGWDYSAMDLGRANRIDGPLPELSAFQRWVLPIAEVRADFTLSRHELDDVARGARNVDLSALDHAAGRLARGENRAVFHGFPAAGIVGIAEASEHEPVVLDSDANERPVAIASAVETLRRAGVGGPYGFAAEPRVYTEIVEATERGGYPLVDHLREILGGNVVEAPGIDGGVVLSERGGDFLFHCGQDVSIGYAGHDADTVGLYLEESYGFQVLGPDAAVAVKVDGGHAA